MDKDIQFACDGTGPLWQRDYWGVIRSCRVDPKALVRVVRERFDDLAPKEFVRFNSGKGTGRPLSEGDDLVVHIRMAPEAGVRVIHVCDASLTLATLKGHPECGKITFGSYCNDRGDVVFHIRSRARSKSSLDLAGFLTVGDAMQTSTWSDFIDRLSHIVGEGIVGEIYAEKQEVEDDPQDDDVKRPTFIATGE